MPGWLPRRRADSPRSFPSSNSACGTSSEPGNFSTTVVKAFIASARIPSRIESDWPTSIHASSRSGLAANFWISVRASSSDCW